MIATMPRKFDRKPCPGGCGGDYSGDPRATLCVKCATYLHRTKKTRERLPKPNAHGYFMVKVPPGDPWESMGGSLRLVPEHRLVMADHVGRALRSDEHVHHINHDRQDNRIENLELLTRMEHRRVHESERKAAQRAAVRIDVDEAELRRLHAVPGTNAKRIAEAMGINVKLVRARMAEYGLPPFGPGGTAPTMDDAPEGLD